MTKLDIWYVPLFKAESETRNRDKVHGNSKSDGFLERNIEHERKQKREGPSTIL